MSLIGTFRYLFCVTALLLITACGPRPVASDGARRYVDVSALLLQNTKLVLISRSEVQQELRLSIEQVGKIKALKNMPMKDVPGMAELTEKRKTANREELLKIVDQELELYEHHLLTTLPTILTAKQNKRFSEIRRQVEGLNSLKDDPELVAALGLMEEDLQCVKETHDSFAALLAPLYRELGKAMFQGAKESSEHWTQAVTSIEKEKELELGGCLTPAQKEKWDAMKGKPFELPESLTVLPE